MMLHTASEGISFAKKLETDSAGFYETLARRFVEQSEILLSFSEENKKYTTQIERAYYQVITDAIEGGYAFNINTDDYVFETLVQEEASKSDILVQVMKIEETIIRFYTDAAEQSKSLMADVPRAFMLVVKKRNKRLPKLKSLF
jgi:hypothetical protein